jgi:glycerol transport system ATP-binding protein
MYDGQIVQIGTPAELFERPKHTFVGYFIGSPGMNLLPVELDGKRVRLGQQTIDLPAAPAIAPSGPLELGIRPEYIRLGDHGMPVSIRKVEDIGRHKVVRADLDGREIAVILGEDETIPADPKVSFEPAGINLYANSWRIATGA